MPRILAIDWDRHEARALLLASGPTGASVAGAWAVPLGKTGNGVPSGVEVGERLAAAVAGRAGGKLTALVGVGRDHVQMQLLSLPPAPAHELPEMVHFQAEREFTALGADAALDFVPITGDEESPHQVLAVALNATGRADAREICAALGVEPNRIPLRACAAAALVRRAGVVPAGRVALVVNPLTDEADLTVDADGTVMLMRTVRLPGPSDAAARQRALVGEIRRTMAAVRQQSADRKVDQVVVCGLPAPAGQGGGLAEELDIPVTLFDPASCAPSGLSGQDVAAESLARFSAVLGMALGEVDRQPPIVDFANVRRRTEARRFTRVHGLAAAVAAAALLWFAVYLWQQMAGPARQLAELESRIAELQSQADMYKDVTAQAAAVDRWLATDVNWLDELEQFARRVRPEPLSAEAFPAESDVVVTQITMLRPPGIDAAGGRMDLQARAKSDAAVRDLEQRLRDERYRVTPGGVQQDDTVAGYPRALDLQIHVAPPADEEADEPTADSAEARP